MAWKDSYGGQAEIAACEFLRARGYVVVERNWHCPFGEVDLVARDGETLVFVEVKARRDSSFGGAEGALTEIKKERIIATARMYLRGVSTELPVRFDVVTITAGEVSLYQDAFQVEV
jgi:putative endonuclease